MDKIPNYFKDVDWLDSAADLVKAFEEWRRLFKNRNPSIDKRRDILLRIYSPFLKFKKQGLAYASLEFQRDLKETWNVVCDIGWTESPDPCPMVTNFRVETSPTPLQVYQFQYTDKMGILQHLSPRKSEDYVHQPGTYIEAFAPEDDHTVVAYVDLASRDTDILKAVAYWREALSVSITKDQTGRRKAGNKKGNKKIDLHAFETLLQVQLGKTPNEIYKYHLEKVEIETLSVFKTRIRAILDFVDPNEVGHKRGNIR